jgi:hypothetical protein
MTTVWSFPAHIGGMGVLRSSEAATFPEGRIWGVCGQPGTSARSGGHVPNRLPSEWPTIHPKRLRVVCYDSYYTLWIRPILVPSALPGPRLSQASALHLFQFA